MASTARMFFPELFGSAPDAVREFRDGLLIVDLRRTAPKLLDRYTGKQAASLFHLAHESQKIGASRQAEAVYSMACLVTRIAFWTATAPAVIPQ
ncbi:MAG: hypothetical protein ACJ746_30835 [Bryobacteraceae bacterium]